MVKRSIPPAHNILSSFHYFKDYDFSAIPDLTIIADSGAFSAMSAGVKVEVKDLAKWAIQWKDHFKWVASLDVIGNPVRTYSNWREMVDIHGVQAIPTIHFGTHPSELDKYGRRGVDLVGLGGLVKVPTNSQMRWLIQVFKYAKKNWPDMQFHGWGCTSHDHFRLPFYSVDSSSWTAPMRYGNMRILDPRNGKQVGYDLNGRGAYNPKVAHLLSNYYGFSPAQVSTSSQANRHEMVTLSSLSESVREQRFNDRHGNVTTPSWGVNIEAIKGSRYQRAPRLADTGDNQKDKRSLHLATAQINNASPDIIQEVYSRAVHLACAASDAQYLNMEEKK